ncbi:hypothetical protein NM208_g12927 [Fusarium decemcellulare]|uniref:Uncharacterized protein n=1 Tax=Fusarium decemcellulare TaxID=57161 RepID=A0ACC1RN50_9HYPO|nr:hypothetical protein NM208_g12927 [Fusarium decemcellulare]
MPPGSSQKGTGKKNSAAMQKQSRNTTPAPVATASLPPQEFYDPDYLNTRVILFRNLTYDDIVDQAAEELVEYYGKALNFLRSWHETFGRRAQEATGRLRGTK